MDAVLTGLYQVLDLDKSRLACVAYVSSAPWREPHVVDRENNCVEKRFVRFIKGTVNKNVSVIVLGSDDFWQGIQLRMRGRALVDCAEFHECSALPRSFEASSRTASLTALLIASLVTVRGGAIGANTFRGSLGGCASER